MSQNIKGCEEVYERTVYQLCHTSLLHDRVLYFVLAGVNVQLHGTCIIAHKNKAAKYSL